MERQTREVADRIAAHSFMHAGRKVVIHCEADSRIDQSLVQGHFYEHKMLGYITRTCRAGGFLDIGANCGHHIVYFALFAPSTKVIAFEPFPNHHKLIALNIGGNGLEAKVVAFPFGAAASYDTFEIRTNSANHESRSRGICVPVDSVVHDFVSVIKVDVEGMELQALMGARRVISQFKPQIFVESHSEPHLREIVEFLGGLGYSAPETSFNASPTWEFVHSEGR